MVAMAMKFETKQVITPLV